MCNGRQDCPLGDDEHQCVHRKCTGLFKCKSANTCVHYNEFCDDMVDCPLADDELFCDLPSCPSSCQCLMAALTCFNASIQPHTYIASFLFISLNKSPLQSTIVDELSNVVALSLINDKSVEFCLHIKNQMQHLIYLDLSGNEIIKITKTCLCKAPNLLYLSLSRNDLKSLSKNLFSCVFSLFYLDVSSNRISFFPISILMSLGNLAVLNVLNNSHVIGVDMDVISPSLKLVLTTDFHLCCFTMHPTNCTAKVQWPYACGRLLGSLSLSVMVWCLTVCILFTNALALSNKAYKSFKFINASETKRTYGLTVTFLNIADGLNGVHLLVVACADAFYGKTFIAYETIWRRGFSCNFISALSLFANLMALVLLTLIAFSRLMIIIFPIKTRFKEIRFILKVLMLCTLIVITFVATDIALLLAVSKEGQPLPLCLMYGTSTGIIAVISGIYASIQLLATCVILVLYILIIYFLYKSDKGKAHIDTKRGGYVTYSMLAKLILVNISNCLCWLPSSFLLFTTLVASEYPISLLFWVTLVLTPTNCIINPCILRLNKIGTMKDNTIIKTSVSDNKEINDKKWGNTQ